MRRKSNWDKGYDFEEGRQAYQDRKKAREDFMEGLGVPKPSKPSKSSKPSGSSGGGGFGGSGLAGIGIGGVIFLFFVLLCFCSIVGDAIDSLDQSDEIATEKKRMERQGIENSIKQWIIETNLMDEFLPCEDWGDAKRKKSPAEAYITVENHIDKEYRGVRFCQIVAKERNVYANIVVRFNTPFFGDKSEQLILHSVDAGDNWRILWRSDKDRDKIKGDSDWCIQDMEIIDDYGTIKLHLSEKAHSSMDDWRLYNCAICTYDGGKTWRLEVIS